MNFPRPAQRDRWPLCGYTVHCRSTNQSDSAFHPSGVDKWVVAHVNVGYRGNVGLASHWPCVTDNSGLLTYGINGLCKGDEHPAYTPLGVWPSFTFSLPYSTTCCLMLFESDLYSTFIVGSHSRRSTTDHTVYLQITQYLPLPRKRSPDGATTDCGGRHIHSVQIN